MTYPRRKIKARNPWLVRSWPDRGGNIAGAMIHSTRSGKVLADEGERTEGWWSNPINKEDDNPPWGSYADALLFKGTGTQVICTDPDKEYAAWTAGYGAAAGTWAAGMYYLQLELPQGTLDEPFEEVVIDSAAHLVAEWGIKYNFPMARLPYLDQIGDRPRGISSHDNCANGRAYGKTDPGPMFPWGEFIERAESYTIRMKNPSDPEGPPPPEYVTKVQFDALVANTKRLNEATVLRGRLRRLADDPDYDRVLKAAEALREAGFTL